MFHVVVCMGCVWWVRSGCASCVAAIAGPFCRAILFSSRGDMAPDVHVNYLYVCVGFLARALDSPVRLGLGSVRIDIRYVSWRMQTLSFGKILYQKFRQRRGLTSWRNVAKFHEIV